MTKPFLKWAGGKSKLVSTIEPYLTGNRLIEPFAGSCALFLGSQFQSAILADVNEDLISLYGYVQKSDKTDFIAYCQSFFVPANNSEEAFKSLRARFNSLPLGDRERAALFIYLNRHAFNGLCRYNASGQFNVPYGKVKTPMFPKEALENFAKRTQSVSFFKQSFIDTMNMAQKGDVIYADPPYAPLSLTASFASYAKEGFSWADHEILAKTAQNCANRGIKVIISNHATDPILELYRSHGADCSHLLDVRRSVSAAAESRKKVQEVLAVFSRKNEQDQG